MILQLRLGDPFADGHGITGEVFIECGSPAHKRHHMSHMERYGWVIQTPTGWEITEAGRAAYQRHLDWFTKATV